MRMSDLSSDVCSSDLGGPYRRQTAVVDRVDSRLNGIGSLGYHSRRSWGSKSVCAATIRSRVGLSWVTTCPAGRRPHRSGQRFRAEILYPLANQRRLAGDEQNCLSHGATAVPCQQETNELLNGGCTARLTTRHRSEERRDGKEVIKSCKNRW